MTPEESDKLFQKLSQIPQTNGQLRKTIGSEFVAEYFQILTAREAVELDWFALTGQMTEAQAGQYSALSGEYELTVEKLSGLARDISVKFTPRLPDLIRADLRGRGKDGLDYLFYSLECLTEMVPAELQKSMSYRHFLGLMFRRAVFGLLGANLINLERSTEDPRIREAAAAFIERADKINWQRMGMQFDGIQLYNEMVFYNKALLPPENRQLFDRLTGYDGIQLSPEKKNALEEQNASDLREIRKEASYKKILLHTLNEQNPQVVALGDDMIKDGEGRRYSQFCAFRMNFNPRLDIGLPKIYLDNRGREVLDYQNLEGVVNFTLNPVTGELQLISNSGVNLSGILDPDRYILLKHYLLTRLREYLQAKDPDIEDLFLPSTTETLQSQVEDTHDQVGMVDIQPEHAIGTDDVQAEPTWKYEPYVAPTKGDNSDEEQTIEDAPLSPKEAFRALSKKQRKIIIDKIWGASGNDVMAALKRMLGESVRQTGSHVFFHSERTNETLPVPKSGYIAPPLLMEMVMAWGYSLREFALELGARV